jgi:HK97 family phage major capsid protein
MYLKVTRAVPGSAWPVGSVQDIPELLGRSFAASGYGEEVDGSAWLQASRAAQDEALRTGIMRDVGEAIKQALAEHGKLKPSGTDGSRTGPPDGGGGVNFKRIAAGEDPADDENKRTLARKDRGIGEALHLIAIAGHPNQFGENAARHAAARLQGMSDNVAKWNYREDSGKFESETTRHLPGGGIETITRTGTDSLSGGATYGFSLKPEYLGNLFEISMEEQVFANAAQQIPVGQGIEVYWPAWDQYQPPTTVNGIQQSAVFAGISLGYVGEISTRPSSDGLLNMIKYKIVDLTGFTTLSRDFVVDNYVGMDSAITRMFGRAIGWMRDYMSIQGAGMGKPQGYFNSSATLVVSRAVSSKIRPVDLTTMIQNTSPMVWKDLRWITNITTYNQLAILYDGTNYVFQPNALISQAMELSIMNRAEGGMNANRVHRPMGTLLGFPLYFSEKVPTLGNTGDLSLVAPSQYGIANRSGLEVAVSEHRYFELDEIAYRFKDRHDMKSLWRAPYQQADGSSTKVSPFVILH